MTFTFLLLNVIVLFASPIYSKDSIICSLHDIYSIQKDGARSEIFIEGSVNVTYDRNCLSVYSHDNTKYSNFLLSDVQINFTGLYAESNELTDNAVSLFLETKIEGIAVHSKNQNRGRLRNCELDLKKNLHYKHDLPRVVQEKIADSAHVCIETKLCEKLGGATQDDYIRAKLENYDFGQNSVMYKAFYENYPMLNTSAGLDKNDKATLQITLNLLADFFLASVATQVSGSELGKINIPDMDETIPKKLIFKEGHFKLTNSTFGDLKTLKRLADVSITNTGLEFKLEAGFQLTKAFVSSNFNLTYVINKSGKIDINLDDVRCTIRASMNYNRRPCVTKLISIHFEVKDISFELNNADSVVDNFLSGVANKVLRAYTDTIIRIIQTKIKNTIGSLLKDFDCEKYRP